MVLRGGPEISAEKELLLLNKISNANERRQIMSSAEERLLQWLRDAHAMEKQAEQMLSGLAGRIKSYPQLKQKIEEHERQSRDQAQRVKGCIERLGGDTSLLKDAAAKFLAVGQGFSGLFVGDEVIKGSLACYTFEHMEIASYEILVAAAEEFGDSETVKVCEEILEEEEEMAEWLLENMAPLTREYLNREEKDLAEARR
jgi:ferritin-like metal-binding protein YciE